MGVLVGLVLLKGVTYWKSLGDTALRDDDHIKDVCE